jgi:hypothetical protein
VSDFLKFVQLKNTYWPSRTKESFKLKKKFFYLGLRPKKLRDLLMREDERFECIDDVIKRLHRILESFSFESAPKPAKVTSSPQPTTPAKQPSSQMSPASTPSRPNSTPPQQHSNDKKSVKAVKSGGRAVKPPKPAPSLILDPDDEVNLFDTGSAVHTVPTASSLTPSSISTELDGLNLFAANASNIQILAKGHKYLTNTLSMPSTYLTPSVPEGIVSPQLLIKDNDISIVLHKDKVYSVPKSDIILPFLENIINHATVSPLAILDPIDNLYKIRTSSPYIPNPPPHPPP